MSFPTLATPGERAQLERLRAEQQAAGEELRAIHRRINELDEQQRALCRAVKARSVRLHLNHQTTTRSDGVLERVYVAEASESLLWVRFGASEAARGALLHRGPGGWVGTLYTADGEPVDLAAWATQADGDAARDEWLRRDTQGEER